MKCASLQKEETNALGEFRILELQRGVPGAEYVQLQGRIVREQQANSDSCQ